jgi:hypothetical protein
MYCFSLGEVETAPQPVPNLEENSYEIALMADTEEIVSMKKNVLMGDGTEAAVSSPEAVDENMHENGQEKSEITEASVEHAVVIQEMDDAQEEKKNEEAEIIPSSPLERDFDKNPTELYLMIQRKQWIETVERAQNAHDEARIWISRKETDGSVRWRLLPIHAAIVFKAPEDVVEALLAAYPNGAQSKDDQGMLPLHLAFRNGSTEGIVNLLLVAYPRSINVKDRKGRIPLVLAQASTSPNRDSFMKALERGPTYYAVAAAATERATVTAEQRAIFDAKLMQVSQTHQYEVTQLKIGHENRQQELQLRLDAMEKELLKTQETSQVLVDHVNSLEAQLTSRSDTERFLATKIANLDSSLKNSNRTKEEIETSLKTENDELIFELQNATTKFEQLELNYSNVKEKLDLSLSLYEKMEKDSVCSDKTLMAQIKSLERDWANAQANCAILEAQLKKKMNTEHALATQVSALASKLAESTAEARDNTNVSSKRIRTVEAERKLLRESVQDLTKRLSLVAKVLDQMTNQQRHIIDKAKMQNEQSDAALSEHAKLIADAMHQDEASTQAKEEREQMKVLLKKQEQQEMDSVQGRVHILNALSMQGQNMESVTKNREEMVEQVKTLGTEIQEIMDTVLNGIPSEVEDSEKLVNEIMKVCMDTSIAGEDEETSETNRESSLKVDTSTHLAQAELEEGFMTPRTMQEKNQGESPEPEEIENTSEDLVEATEDSAVERLANFIDAQRTDEEKPEEENLGDFSAIEESHNISSSDRIEAARSAVSTEY